MVDLEAEIAENEPDSSVTSSMLSQAPVNVILEP